MHKDEAALKLAKRFKKIKGERQNWDDHWRDLADYIIPKKSDIYIAPHDRTRGEKKNNPFKLFDSTAINANNKLAASLHSMLTSPTVQWFELATGDFSIDRNDEARLWLQEATRIMHNVLNATNFQTEIHEVYQDLGCFGTSVLQIESDEERILRFKSRPIYECYIEEDAYGKVATLYRDFKIPIKDVVELFGEDSLSTDMKKIYEKDPSKKVYILHAVMPHKDAEIFELTPDKGYKKNYCSIYMYIDKPHILQKSGFTRFPYVTPRWSKISGEVYGRSPGMAALPDIQLLNEMEKVKLRYAQKQTDPPMLVPDDGFGLPLDLRPGGTTYVRAGTQDEIKPIPIGGRPEITERMVQEKQSDVRMAFHNDSLQLREGPQKTAQEVMQLTDESLRFMAPQLARQHSELVEPIVDRLFEECMQRELFPDVPEILGGTEVVPRYTSQVAKAQRASEGQSLMNMIQQAGPVLQMAPESLDVVNTDEYVRLVGFINGAPQQVINNAEIVAQTRQQRAEAQQKQAGMDEVSQSAESMGKLAPMINNASEEE